MEEENAEVEPELRELLDSLGLRRYIPSFEEEAITEVSLLTTMGADGLMEAMDELGMDEYGAMGLRDALFSGKTGGDDEEDGLELEDNDEADEEDELELEDNDGPVLRSGTAPAPLPTKPAPAAKQSAVKKGFLNSAPALSSVGGSEQATRLKKEGNDALARGDFQLAIDFYTKAISCERSNSVFYSNRSHAYASLRNWDEALADANKAVTLRPDWAKGYVRRGAAMMGLGKHIEAEKEYTRAVDCEPKSNQLQVLLQEASEAVAADEAEATEQSGMTNWVAVLNEEVRHKQYYDAAQTDDGELVAMEEYRSALSQALEELSEAVTPIVRAGTRGHLIDVKRVSSVNVEKMHVDGNLRRSGRPVQLRMRHITNHYDWEDEEAPDQDEMVRQTMQENSDKERALMAALTGCMHWVQLVPDLSAETEVRVGAGEDCERYPCMVCERFDGLPLHEMLSQDGCGEDSDDPPSLEELERDLELVFAVALACARALDEAHHAGYVFDKEGKNGPYIGGVSVRELNPGVPLAKNAKRKKGSSFEVKVMDVEPLEKRVKDECNLYALQMSPVGEWIRQWWQRTALKLNIGTNEKSTDSAVAELLEGYGTLNWLLFGWPKDQLGATNLINLMMMGPSAGTQRPPEQLEALEKRWESFQQEAFVRLGPRRFDELKATINLYSEQAIKVDEAVARARYFMMPDHEDLYMHFQALLKM